MAFSKIIDRGNGPTRLFIGGVHGREGLTTINALTEISERSIKDGRLILINCPSSEYTSTLNKDYYTSKTGKEILALIDQYKPDIYLELHCYRKESYNKLTGKDRRYKNGVPPLIELENKVLIGSISPLIRITFFEKYDFSFALEVPCNPSPESMKVYIDVLNMVAQSRDRFEILEKLESKYPSAVKKARQYFLEFSDNFVILFKEIQKEIEKNTITNDSDGIKEGIEDTVNVESALEKIMEKASEKGLSVTPKQAEMIVQAVLLSKERFSDFELKKSWCE
jgi:hypothetical protein